MIKYFYVFLWLLGVSSSQAQLIFEKNLSEAFEKAKKEKKMVFVKYYNSDCPVCKKLDEFFQDKKLSDFYNANFINYALNTKEISEQETKLLKDANLNFTSVPYLLFFDYNGSFCHYSFTQQDHDFLLQAAQNALKPSERTINLANKYKSGDRSIRTLYAYNNFLQIQKQDDLARIVAKDLFEVFPKENLATKKSYTITRDCVTDIDNGFFQFWIKNIEKAAEFHTIEKVKSDLGEIIVKSIYYPNRPTWSLEKIATVKSYIVLTGVSQHPDNFFWQEESKVLVEQRREKQALEIVRKIFEADEEIASKLFSIKHLAEISKDKTTLQTLQKWLKSIVMDKAEPSEQADYYYVQLMLFKKIGDKHNFQKVFDIAKTYCQKHNLDSKEIENLK
jgi:thiol-disulfide isomerase/thioredoxin